MAAPRTDSPIARARRAAGLTQAALAERIGVLPTQLSNWECGVRRPKLDALLRIAAALDVDLSDLLDGPRPGESPLPF